MGSNENGQPVPLDQQAVQLEAVPPMLARVFEAHDVRTWAEAGAMSEAILLVQPGVGRQQIRWLRIELARRRAATRWGHELRLPLFAKLPLPEKVPDRAGVYVIQCGRVVKIGMARSVRRRLAVFNQTIPFRLELIGVIVPPVGQSLRELEREIHQRLSAHRHCGEWFIREGLVEEFCTRLEAVGVFELAS
jgi:hypothetical protein